MPTNLIVPDSRLFYPPTITAMVNEVETAERPLYDMLFKANESMSMSQTVEWDIVRAARTLVGESARNAPMKSSKHTTREVVSRQAPYYSDSKTIRAEQIQGLRRYGGSSLEFENLENFIARETADVKSKFDRTLEFNAWGVMKGNVYDKDGITLLYKYDFPDGHDNPAATEFPINDLRKIKSLIRRNARSAVRRFIMLTGTKVMDQLVENPSVQKLFLAQSGLDIAKNGYITGLAGIEFMEFDHGYEDDDGDFHRYLAEDECIIVGVTDDGFASVYAPPAVFDKNGNVPFPDKKTGMIYADLDYHKNPESVDLLFGMATVQITRRPGAIAWMKPDEWTVTP